MKTNDRKTVGHLAGVFGYACKVLSKRLDEVEAIEKDEDRKEE